MFFYHLQGVGDLQSRLSTWMSFWSDSGWSTNSGNKPSKPFMLLASAEVTLGVKGILEVLWHRLWHLQSSSSAPPLLVQPLPDDDVHYAEGKLQRTSRTTGERLLHEAAVATAGGTRQQNQYNGQNVLATGLQQWLSSAGSLYEIGMHTNQQLLSELLQKQDVSAAVSLRTAFTCCDEDNVSKSP